jgi:hypothetical protein
MRPDSLDSGERVRYRGAFADIDPAIDALIEIVDGRPEGWRVRIATLRCPTDRGRRVSLQVEMVSEEWVREQRERRREKQA